MANQPNPISLWFEAENVGQITLPLIDGKEIVAGRIKLEVMDREARHALRDCETVVIEWHNGRATMRVID